MCWKYKENVKISRKCEKIWKNVKINTKSIIIYEYIKSIWWLLLFSKELSVSFSRYYFFFRNRFFFFRSAFAVDELFFCHAVVVAVVVCSLVLSCLPLCCGVVCVVVSGVSINVDTAVVLWHIIFVNLKRYPFYSQHVI